MDCSLPGSSVHGILQARILEWVDSGGSSQPRDRTHISRFSALAGGFFTISATKREAHLPLEPPECSQTQDPGSSFKFKPQLLGADGASTHIGSTGSVS